MTPLAAVLAGLVGACPVLLKITFLSSTLSEINGITIEATVVVFAIASSVPARSRLMRECSVAVKFGYPLRHTLRRLISYHLNDRPALHE